MEGGTPDLSKPLRLWPQRGVGEGHFLALMQRADGWSAKSPDFAKPRSLETSHSKWMSAPRRLESVRTIVRAHSNRAHYTIHHKAIQLYCDFCREALVEDSGGPDGQGLELRGAYLYRLPLGSPGLEVLRVIHPGWWLGTLKKGRFEPSPALAMRLPADSARQTLRLKTRDARLLAYLRGEPLLEAGQEGWVLVSVEGFPLGWDRRVGGLIKNYYPRGLRWR